MRKGFMIVTMLLAGASVAAAGTSKDEMKRVTDAARVLREIRAAPDKGIPESIWQRARCVAVMPDVKKAAFVVGGEYGKGVMSCRIGTGWSAPVFLRLEKGSFGAQIGAESTDVVLLVMNEHGIERLLHAEILERRRAEAELEDVAGRLIHAQEEERGRIGRELHDHISQMLGILTIEIDQLHADGASASPAIADALGHLRQRVSEISDDVHRLSHRLHSSTLDYLGLAPALQKLVGEFSQRHDIAISFAHDALPSSMPSDVALCLFRIVEEALNNIGQTQRGPVRADSCEEGFERRPSERRRYGTRLRLSIDAEKGRVNR